MSKALFYVFKGLGVANLLAAGGSPDWHFYLFAAGWIVCDAIAMTAYDHRHGIV